MGPRLCDGLLTIKEAAWHIDVSVVTLRRWIRRGDVRTVQVRPNATIRIPTDEVRRFAQAVRAARPCR